jgi:uncharacterized protein (TIGR02265 family)
MPSFVTPDWNAPLDTEAHLRSIPAGSIIKGMYPAAIVAEAKKRGLKLPHAGDKYLPFLDYPMTDHTHLLVEGARAFFPELPIRQALRKIGRAAVGVFMHSTLGKAMLGGLTQPETTLRALAGMVRAYTTSLGKPTPHVEVREVDDTACIVTLSDFWLFIDSHQVGILEGVCRACGVRGDMRVAMEGASRGQIECRWEVVPPSRPSVV